MRKMIWPLALIWLLTACQTLAPLPPATATPASTRTLPPEDTPMASATALPTLDSTPSAPLSVAGQAAALLEAFDQDVSVLDDGTVYTIEAKVDFDGQASVATIDGTARIRYTHNGSEPLADIALMLWPNNEQYRSSMSVGPALIKGELVAGDLELAGLAIRYGLPKKLVAGESVDLSVPFHIRAEGPIGGQTPHRFGISEGVLFAPTFYPIVPRRIDGAWEVRQAPPGGDTTNSLVSAYRVQLNVPADLDLVATGVAIAREPLDSDRAQVDYVSGPVRDFAFALGEMETGSRLVDGVRVNVWVLPSHEDEIGRVLRAAADQVNLLDDLVGAYPYTELDVVDVPGAYGGIEYPGLVSIGTLGTQWVIEPVVHEVAHQWFYGLIGDDQLDEPWMDEAFATYATALYYENVVGGGRATGYLADFRDRVRNAPDPGMPIGLGVGNYVGAEYSTIVYLKGALFYQELRQQLGDDLFFEFLQDFFDEYRYRIASAADFEMTAESTCGCQLDELFDQWVFEGGPSPSP
jgi:hypothetical protein